ncbi:hypothetical protein L7F22_049049 [Adiantum nelumboides]|nr:hypothetical protein [Adiantum nelumboides]
MESLQCHTLSKQKQKEIATLIARASSLGERTYCPKSFLEEKAMETLRASRKQIQKVNLLWWLFLVCVCVSIWVWCFADIARHQVQGSNSTSREGLAFDIHSIQQHRNGDQVFLQGVFGALFEENKSEFIFLLAMELLLLFLASLCVGEAFVVLRFYACGVRHRALSCVCS